MKSERRKQGIADLHLGEREIRRRSDSLLRGEERVAQVIFVVGSVVKVACLPGFGMNAVFAKCRFAI